MPTKDLHDTVICSDITKVAEIEFPERPEEPSSDQIRQFLTLEGIGIASTDLDFDQACYVQKNLTLQSWNYS
jgi:hypothetical protein